MIYYNFNIILKLIFRLYKNTKNDDWLKPNTYEEQFELLKNYNNKMDYNKINRSTCSVCSRFSIILDEKYEYSIDYLSKFRWHKGTLNEPLLDITNLSYHLLILLHDPKAALYEGHFAKLNGMILNREGFNSNKTVNIFLFIN